jgi:hypothetical protein
MAPDDLGTPRKFWQLNALPVGVEREMRYTDSHPEGCVVYKIMCPVHPENRADSLTGLADYINAHCVCRCVNSLVRCQLPLAVSLPVHLVCVWVVLP